MHFQTRACFVFCILILMEQVDQSTCKWRARVSIRYSNSRYRNKDRNKDGSDSLSEGIDSLSEGTGGFYPGVFYVSSDSSISLGKIIPYIGIVGFLGVLALLFFCLYIGCKLFTKKEKDAKNNQDVSLVSEESDSSVASNNTEEQESLNAPKEQLSEDDILKIATLTYKLLKQSQREQPYETEIF